MFEAILYLRADCKVCLDRGALGYNVPFGDPHFGKWYPCPHCQTGADILQRQWERRLLDCKLPKRFQDCTFATWEALTDEERVGKYLSYWCARLFVDSPSHEVNCAQAYELCGRAGLNITRNSLIFQGIKGLGKTGLAAAIINALAAQNKPVLYVSAQDYLDSVKARFGLTDPSDADVVAAVCNAPVLVLDEFNMPDYEGKSRTAEDYAKTFQWRQETMKKLIRYRHGHLLPTIITCNASEKVLEQHWGSQTTDPLFEMAHWIPMGGKELRDKRQPKGDAF